MEARRAADEHKSLPEIQAELRARLAELEARGGGDAVVTLNPLGNGSLTIQHPTKDRPSQRSLTLADTLGALAEADGAPRGLWDPSPDAAGAKWLGELDDALERHGITRAEWARLMTTFGQLAAAKGWMGAAGQRDLAALVRLRVGRAEGGRG